MGRDLAAFISYRRQDAFISITDGRPDFAFIGKLERALTAAGFTEVFVDTEDIEVTEDYRGKIEVAISNSDLVVAVVGGKWMTILKERTGTDQFDMLVHEIWLGLDQEKKIVPLLVDDAVMPRASELPKSIQRFHYQQSLSVETTSPPDEITSELKGVVDRINQERRLNALALRAYVIFACFAWYCCAVQTNVVGLFEFGYQSWGKMAAIWSGFFVWPIFFLPLTLYALYRPVLLIVESVISSARLQSRLTYASPLIFGVVLAGLGVAVELEGYETPWSIYPRLSGCPTATQSSEFRLLSSYNRDRDATLKQEYGSKFWITDPCWPNVFYYLTVPIYQGNAKAEYLSNRQPVAAEFGRMLIDKDAPYSKSFYAYILSFTILMWLLGTGIMMSIFYVAVQIRRSDNSVLRLPSEKAYLCLSYTFLTVMIWVPFRINTNYFKYLYFCDHYPACEGLDPKLYFPDIVLAAPLVICYVVLTLGLLVKYRRLAIALLGTFSVAVILLVAFAVYLLREYLAPLSDSWVFAVGVSIPIILAMAALGYVFDPSIARFNDDKAPD